MNRKNLNSNISNKQGILLLSEEQELSEGWKSEIHSYLTSEDLRRKNDVINRMEQTCQNLGITNDRLFRSSSKIVLNIILESKNQPWRLHIHTLSNYVDWLYTHSINVSLLSTMIAESLNLNELNEIALGSFLHDIGKLMISKSIIEKTDKLTEEEFFYIHQHCDLGIHMVKNLNLPQISLDIIQQHHERLDGLGYPNGLSDSQIPIHSRIVIIADVLDAITSYRPYRLRRSIASAINELKEYPSQYPKEILDVFNESLL